MTLPEMAPVPAWHIPPNVVWHLHNGTLSYHSYKPTFDIWYKAKYRLYLPIYYASEKQQHMKMSYTLNSQHIVLDKKTKVPETTLYKQKRAGALK